MAARKQYSRARWLAAGAALASRKGLGSVNPAALAAKLGAGPRDFARHFDDRDAFLRALMAHGLDEVRTILVDSTSAMKPGHERMITALRTWLDAHAARHWLRQLMSDLAAEKAMADLARTRVRGFTLMLQIELQALGWPRAAVSARLATAAAMDVSLAEFEAQRPLSDLRETLFAYLRKH